MTDYMSFQRSITIPASAAQISEEIVDFKKWRNWSPWEDLDPNLQRTYSGTESGIGAKYAWVGNKKAGAGSMEITSVEPDKIDIDLNFLKPMKVNSKSVISLRESDGQTTVEWTVLNPKTMSMKIFSKVFNLDKAVGGDLERGLAKLKSLFEN